MESDSFRYLRVSCLVAVSLLPVFPPPAVYAVVASPQPERIALWPNQAPLGDGAFAATNAFITVYRPARPNGVAVVICPGGGYGALKPEGMEGRGAAEWLNAHGIVGVVLAYRLPQGRSFVPLLDAQRAIRTVRVNAKEWGCDPARVGILGFSAGGHLASTAGTHFDDGLPAAADPVEHVGCRPAFMVLVYPVISMGPQAHGGSKKNLLGPNPPATLVELFSNERQVTDRTPPTFLAHARDDSRVSPDHSRLFLEALQTHHVAAQYLELPSGDHGLNDRQGPMWETWKTDALKWLAEQGLIPHDETPKMAPVSRPE